MRSKVLLAAGAVICIGVPVSASAGICDGVLSWLCSGAESSESGTARKKPLGQVTAPRQVSTSNEETRSPNTGADCLSLNQVRGGYPRYRVINGRHCWYASYASVKSRHRKPTETNVNPYDDPIWKEADAARVKSADCEIQSLKLDGEEQRGFMKECMSGNVR
jgi:hypothetical protein